MEIIISNTMLNDYKMLIFHIKNLYEQSICEFFSQIYVYVQTAAREQSVLL